MTAADLKNFMSNNERAAWDACLRSSIVHLEKAREIVRAGERVEALVVVISGWLQRYKERRGRRQIVSLYLPGAISDQSALTGQAATTTLAAVRDADVALVDACDAHALFARYPGLARFRRASLAATIRIEREWMANLGLRNAEERIAHLCCELVVRQGKVLKGVVEAALPLNQAQLGEAVGLTPVHVNRTIAQLRRRYGLTARDRRLRVTDAAGLAALAEFDDSYLEFDEEGLLAGPNEPTPLQSWRNRAEPVVYCADGCLVGRNARGAA
jgi:CRP-like cAMP-binding protein